MMMDDDDDDGDLDSFDDDCSRASGYCQASYW
jgi:hypothetical protein